jgi:hypothetical protein
MEGNWKVLEFFGPIVFWAAIAFLYVWGRRRDRRRIERTTDTCPTCGGDGRVSKRSQP